MSGPSDKAVAAAAETLAEGLENYAGVAAQTALLAAHDPALGLDRSVCLRDVVWSLRDYDDPEAADFLKREFGGES